MICLFVFLTSAKQKKYFHILLIYITVWESITCHAKLAIQLYIYDGFCCQVSTVNAFVVRSFLKYMIKDLISILYQYNPNNSFSGVRLTE